MKAVRAASARVVINGRIVRGWGDYASTADRPAEFPPHDGDWEGIPTTNESYGWNQFDDSHKSPAHFIQLLAKAAARGGNILMNVGPMGDGRMDPKDVAILKRLADWWIVNGESIRGTTRTPLPVQAWGESTRKGNTLYLHVFNWPANGELVVGGLKSNVKRARLLAERTIQQPPALKAGRENSLDVKISGLPAIPPGEGDFVIVLECDGAIQTDTGRLLQPGFANDTLRVFDADLHGSGLKFGPGKVRDAHVTGWTKADDYIAWPVRLNRDAMFEVLVTYDAEPDSAGNTFELMAGKQKLQGTVAAGLIRTNALGRISLTSGSSELRISPVVLKQGELMQLRTVELKAVAKQP
jgi:hypothetical protein